jgi:hypothetical protein
VKIVGRRDFEVGGVTCDHANRQPQTLHQRGIIGRHHTISAGASERLSQQSAAEDLRGLSQPDAVAGWRSRHDVMVIDDLDSVATRYTEHRGARASRNLDRRSDAGGWDERADPIMDCDQIHVAGDRPQARGNRLLALGPSNRLRYRHWPWLRSGK